MWTRPVESWYARAGQAPWMPDFGFNLKPQYFTGDVADPSTWRPTGQLNDVRASRWPGTQIGRVARTLLGDELRRPGERAPPIRSAHDTNGWGQVHPVLCLEQYIAPTMPTLGFPGNASQKTYPTTGVQLPN